MWVPYIIRTSQLGSADTAHDFFCGCGGDAIALDAAGFRIVAAVNHDPLAIATHQQNFQYVPHDLTDITAVDPGRYPRATVGIFTPECTFFSDANSAVNNAALSGQLLLWDDIDPVAAGIRETAERSRVTMTEVIRFSAYHRYQVVIVENVIKIFNWWRFNWWLGEMGKLGYEAKAVISNTQFAPADPHAVPQSRNRVYVVFWRKELRTPDLTFTPEATCPRCGVVAARQVFKNPSRLWGDYGHKKGRGSWYYACPECRQPIRPHFSPASDIIDWSLPAETIGARAEAGDPLKDTSLARIRYGLEKYGSAMLIDTAFTHCQHPNGRVRPVDEPLPTQTKRQVVGLVIPPMMITLRGTEDRQVRSSAQPVSEPLSTVCAKGQHHGLLLPPEAEHAFTVQYYKQFQATPIDEPIPTIPSKDRHGLVITQGATRLEDCRFRMLEPDELKRGMGFPSDYVVLGNKKEQVKQIGLSIGPAEMVKILRRVKAVLQ